MTKAVNLRQEKYDTYIGRAGHGQNGYFGNPFSVQEHGTSALDKYRTYFKDRIEKDPEFRRRILALRGHKLGCFCKPKPCHGDVIAEWVDKN